MPSRHHSSSHHSSSHHSSTHHNSIHHSTPSHHIHHTNHIGTTIGPDGMPIIMSSRRRSGFGLGCGITIAIFVLAIFGTIGVIIYSTQQAFNTASSAFTSMSTAFATDSTDSNSSEAALLATTQGDLGVMQSVLDPQIAKWEADKTIQAHYLTPDDVHLPTNFNTKEVVYGYCSAEEFYTYVLNVTKPEDVDADTEGYAYIPEGTPSNCVPKGWKIVTTETTPESQWTFVTINTSGAAK